MIAAPMIMKAMFKMPAHQAKGTDCAYGLPSPQVLKVAVAQGRI